MLIIFELSHSEKINNYQSKNRKTYSLTPIKTIVKIITFLSLQLLHHSNLISSLSSSSKKPGPKILSRNRIDQNHPSIRNLYISAICIKSGRVGSYKTRIDRFLFNGGSGDGSPTHCSTGNKFDRRASTVWRAFRIAPRGLRKGKTRDPRFEADDRSCARRENTIRTGLVPKKGVRKKEISTR